MFIFGFLSLLVQPTLNATSLQAIRPQVKKVYPAIFEGLSSTLLRYKLAPSAKNSIVKAYPEQHNRGFANTRYQSTFSNSLLPVNSFPQSTFPSNQFSIQRYYSNSPKLDFSAKQSGSWDEVYSLAQTLEKQIENPDTSLRDYKFYPKFLGYEIPFFGVGLPKFFIDMVEERTSPLNNRFVGEAVFERIKQARNFDLEEPLESINDIYEATHKDGPWVLKINLSDPKFTDGKELPGHTFVLEKSEDGSYHRFQSNNGESLLNFMKESQENGLKTINKESIDGLLVGLEFLLDDSKGWTKETRDLLYLFKGLDVSKVEFSPQDLENPLEFEASISYK